MKASATTKTPKSKEAPKKDFVADVEVTTDLLQVLHKDHKDVSELFFQYTQAEEDKEKKELVAQIINQLTLHAKAEEEVVYPAVRKGAEDVKDLMDEADTEHHVVKFLLAELAEMSPKDDHYDSKVTVLCELVKHHVEEEEKEMFEKIKTAKLDLESLGKEFIARKEVLSQKPLAKGKVPLTRAKSSTKRKAA